MESLKVFFLWYRSLIKRVNYEISLVFSPMLQFKRVIDKI